MARISLVELTSSRNPLLQKVRRAASSGRPTEDGLIVAEGPHLLAEAWRGRWTIERVFVTPAARQRHADLLNTVEAELIEVSERAMAATASVESSQNILALLRPAAWSWRDLVPPAALLVVLDGLQDPGNVGAIVRSAEAFGSTGIVLLKGSARVSNSKLLRAAAGSLFRLPFLEDIPPSELLGQLFSQGLTPYALTAQGQTPVSAANWCRPCALLVGNEGRGLSPRLLNQAEALSIQTDQVESLNAAVACSLALYEARRQRRPA